MSTRDALPAARPPHPEPEVRLLLLYDGVCGFCDAFVQFVTRRDSKGLFHFAALQSPAAERHVRAAGGEPALLPDSLVLISGGEIHLRSTAALRTMIRLGGFWGGTARGLLLVPRPLRDAAYDLFARYRYRIFGRKASCDIPDPATRGRFLWD